MTHGTHDLLSVYLDLKQTHAEFGISPRSSWDLIRTGRVKAYRPMWRRVYLRRNEVEQLFQKPAVEPALDRIVAEVLVDLKHTK